MLKPYALLNKYGLIGLYHRGLFDPVSCDYEGTFFQKAWESKEIPHLFEQQERRESKCLKEPRSIGSSKP